MESIMKSDIFFFISTIALVVVTILIAIALVYLIKTLKIASKLTEKLEKDWQELSVGVKSGWIYRFIFPHKKEKKVASKKNSE